MLILSTFDKYGNLCGASQTLTQVRVKIKPAQSVLSGKHIQCLDPWED